MERRLEWLQIGRRLALACSIGVLGAGIALMAQDAPVANPPQPQSWSAEQLDNLVAPIALYPDPLVGQVLAASTYPLELVEAQQWVQANPNLKGKDLVEAAKQQNWDPSVQALVAMPDVLKRLTQDVQWTTDLGNAFLAQQSDVMAAIQRMRVRAQQRGRLNSDSHQVVTTEQQNGQSAIQIMPADPQVIYVPVYDPVYVYGPPVWGWYPPLWYPDYGWGWGFGINIGWFFGGWNGWGWGLGPVVVRRRHLRQQLLLPPLRVLARRVRTRIRPRSRLRPRRPARSRRAHGLGSRPRPSLGRGLCERTVESSVRCGVDGVALLRAATGLPG